jgi:hypothetical protein
MLDFIIYKKVAETENFYDTNKAMPENTDILTILLQIFAVGMSKTELIYLLNGRDFKGLFV